MAAVTKPTPSTAGTVSAPSPLGMTLRQRCLIVLAAWSFAIAQPLYFQWGSHAAFVHDMGVVQGALWLVMLVVSVIAPLLVCAPLALIHRSRPAWARWGFRVLQALLVTVLLLQVTRDWLMMVGVPASLGGAVLAVWLAERFVPARRFLAVASLGVVVFPAMFVALSAIYPLALPLELRRALESKRSGSLAANPVPVVFVVFDEFTGTALWTKDRQLDGQQFPNFAQLGRDGLWYRNATTVHAETSAALPALLSGTYPPTDPHVVHQPAVNLFSLLIDDQGYDGLVFEPITRLCNTPALEKISTTVPDAPRWRDFVRTTAIAFTLQIIPIEANDFLPGIPRLPTIWFGVFDQAVDTTATRGVIRYAWAADRPRQMAQFLKGLSPSDRPTLYFFHVVFPHRPYRLDRFGNLYSQSDYWDFPRPQDLGGTISDAVHATNHYPDDKLFCAQAQLRFLWQAEGADLFVGQLREQLLATGLYDKCLLIVMADHGVSQRPHGQHRFVNTHNQLDLASIPLFVKLPGSRKGGPVDLPVESIDVLPTIADVLKLPDPPVTDGQSLLSRPYRPRPSKRIAFGKHLLVLPGDYPAEVAAEELPLLSSDVEPVIRKLVGHEALLGRNVGELAGAASEFRIVNWLSSMTELLSQPTTAVYLAGIVEPKPPKDPPLTLALAFDGRIVALTRTFLDDKEAEYFQFLLPPEDHAAAVKSFEVFEVRNGAALELRKLAVDVRPSPP